MVEHQSSRNPAGLSPTLRQRQALEKMGERQQGKSAGLGCHGFMVMHKLHNGMD
jgi:hypothetical protein